MSNIVLQPNSSGTGSITIATPNTNTDRTLNIPDEAGTLLSSASSVASSKLTGALPALDGSALTGVGKILQVVQSQGTSSITFSQDFSAYSTIVNATITPSSTTSGILIMVQNAVDGCGSGSYPALKGHIARGATSLDGMELVLYQGSTQSHRIAVIHHNYIDYPNTTSSVTYNSNWANSTGSTQSGTYNGAGNQYDSSRMFLFEIEG